MANCASKAVPNGCTLKAVYPDSGELVKCQHLLDSSEGGHWENLGSDEFGRLSNGNKRVKGTNAMKFIHLSQTPTDKKVTYMRPVVADRPMKENPGRVGTAVGGSRDDNPCDKSTQTADLMAAKMLLNGTISGPGARAVCMNIQDFCLNTQMKRHEHMLIPAERHP